MDEKDSKEKNDKNDIQDEEFDIILKSIKAQKQIKNIEEKNKTDDVYQNEDENSKTKIKDTPIVKPKNEKLTFEDRTQKPQTKNLENQKSSENIVYFDDIDKNNKEVPKKTKKTTSFLGSAYAGIIKLLIFIAFVCVSVYFLSTTIIDIANDMFAFVKPDHEITVSIPEGASTSEIAKILKKNGIIENNKFFKFYTDLRIKKSVSMSGEFISGEVVLNSNLNYDQIRKKLAIIEERGIVRVMIPEGLKVDEIIDLLIKNGVGTREKYVSAIQNYEYDNEIVAALEKTELSEYRKNSDYSYRLEGYLFPDTYDFYTDESEISVIGKLLSNFENKFSDDFYLRANEMGFTVDQIITIASLIEKEAGIQSDYALVSSVFHNRLKNNSEYPRLESDATIQYALKEHKEELTSADTKYDHPYNTYIYKGLPPGAICNPGYEAIVAALYPAESQFYFFVSGKDKETVFSKTYEEHQEAIRKVLG